MTSNNRNFLIAIAVLLGFMYFWDTAVMSRYRSPQPATPNATAAPTLSSTVPAIPPMASASSPAAAAGQPASASTVVLSNDTTRVSIDTRGATVTSWQIFEHDHWLEMVPDEKTRQHLPLETFPDVNFRVAQKSDTAATFEGTLPSGLVLEKTLSLGDGPFDGLSLTLRNPGGQAVRGTFELGWGDGLDKRPVDAAAGAAAVRTTRAEMRALAKADPAHGDRLKSWRPGFAFQRSIDLLDPTPDTWIAVDNNHFVASLIASTGALAVAHVVTSRDVEPWVGTPIDLTLAAGAQTTFDYKLYVGPKKYDLLGRLPYGLRSAVNFGTFGPIAKGLLIALNFFKGLTGNYGWAIVLLTLVLQILLFPLTRRSYEYSLKMRELGPQLKKLQEQFKSDPKRLQLETMNFYQKRGMKFMGLEGCLPMLLQVPVFIAFYATLNLAYELRGAPWILWIHDLSAKDPHHVLPIIMGLGMFAQQKMTAVAVDPTQARMMYMMPVIFTVMFMNLPAGLVLYWCVNSAMTIAVQAVLRARAKPVAVQP